MKKNYKTIKSPAETLLVHGATLLPFIGLALLLNSEESGIVFGIILLAVGLFTWTVAYK